MSIVTMVTQLYAFVKTQEYLLNICKFVRKPEYSKIKLKVLLS